MKPLASLSHGTRRLALVVLVLVLLTLPIGVLVYAGIPGRAVTQENPVTLNDQLILASSVSGGKASNPSPGSANSQPAIVGVPTITYVLSPAAPQGGDNWYLTDVTLKWTVTDAITKTECVDQSITQDQTEQTYTCSATGPGGSAGPVTVKIKRDATPPKPPKVSAITADGKPYSSTDQLNQPIWTSQDVTVKFDSDGDNMSGVQSCTSPKVVKVNNKSAISGSCYDVAGNKSVLTPFTPYVDKSVPYAKPVLVPPANAYGWNNTDVYVTWNWKDDYSGTNNCPLQTSSATISPGEGTLTLSSSCTDKVGWPQTAQVTVKVDKQKPSLGGESAKTGNGSVYIKDSWTNNPPVKIEWPCVDSNDGPSPSGPITPTVSHSVSKDGANWVLSAAPAECMDYASNQSGGSNFQYVKIDTVDPVINYTVAPTPVNDWNKTDVTVNFTCTDALSGAKNGNIGAPVITTEGKGQSVTSSNACVDNAGNDADPLTVGGINIDKTPPNPPKPVLNPPPNEYGWNKTDVTVSFTANGDNLSGVASCTPAQTFTAETKGTVVTGTCTDVAGNVSDPVTVTVKIDKTDPEITITPGTGCAEPTYVATDAVSGVATSSKTLLTDGTYAIVVTATDYAGNTKTTDPYPFTPYLGDGSLLLSPIHEKGDNLFKLGSVIPIKFRLIDCSGRPVMGADARLKVVFLGPVDSDHQEGPVNNIASPGNADTGNQFRYDNASGQYIFNWGTKNLWVGNFQIAVYIGKLVFKGTTIGLR